MSESVPRLTSLLRAGGVRVKTNPGTKPAPLGSAWTAFKQFAALRVSRKDLENDPMADAFLFEVGTYDSGGKWGRTMEVSFVRQYGMKDGDLQQVHLVAHFPARASTRNSDDASVWSYDTGGDAREAQRRSWIAFVDSSPLLRRALASKELLGYEVWQESVE